MLQTQINYWAYKEQQRNNLVNESIARFNAEEARRSNLARENISYFSAVENQRHNVATEQQAYYNYLESARHNKATEDISYRNIQLGYDTLAETSRHNRASESIGMTQARASLISAHAATTTASANLLNASTNQRNATTRASELALARTKSIYENRAKASEARLNDEKWYAELGSAHEHEARASLYEKQADYYDLEIIRNWVPIINLGGKH